jgi:hypothetical protein
MKSTCIGLLSTAVALVWLGCSTTGARIEQHREAFDSYPEGVQQNLRNGVIEVGYTPEMVLIALGEPSRKVDVATDDATAQVWTWTHQAPGVSLSLGGWNALGSHVALGSGMTVSDPGQREEVAIVEFRHGLVHRIERLAPR